MEPTIMQLHLQLIDEHHKLKQAVRQLRTDSFNLGLAHGDPKRKLEKLLNLVHDAIGGV